MAYQYRVVEIDGTVISKHTKRERAEQSMRRYTKRATKMGGNPHATIEARNEHGDFELLSSIERRKPAPGLFRRIRNFLTGRASA